MLLITENEEEILALNEAVSYSELERQLKKGRMIISFKKKTNGRYRLMYCTRNLEIIPEEDHPTGVGLPYNPKAIGLLPVYDLVKKAWRSFYVKRVSKYKEGGLDFLINILQKRRFTKDREGKRYNIIGGKETGHTMPESFVPDEAIALWEKWDSYITPVMLESSSDNKDLSQIVSDLTVGTIKKMADGLRDIAKKHGILPHKSHFVKMSASLVIIKNFLEKVLKDEASDKDAQRARTALAELIGYLTSTSVGTIISAIPTPIPGVAIMSLLLLKTISDKTGVPLFPKTWADDAVGHLKHIVKSNLSETLDTKQLYAVMVLTEKVEHL